MKPDKVVAIHSFPVWLPQTQTWMHTQVKYLPDSIDAHVACERTENLDQFPVPNLHSLWDVSKAKYFVEKILRKLHIRYPGHLVTVARENNAQVIHSHFGEIGWHNLHMVRKTGAKHIVTFYGYDLTRLPKDDRKWVVRYREMFDAADLFLCEGPHMADKLIELGCPAEKVRVHHLGVDVDSIPFKPRTWEKNTPLRVLIAASFREKKGIPYALNALARLQEKVPLEITIIGDAGSRYQDQEEKKRILDAIQRGGLAAKTRLLGIQPYSVLFDVAYKHHLFISPSVTASDGDTEGGAPVSLIDMIATGMPVVSTKHCDIPEVVNYDLEDWLVNERDVEGLTSKMLWLIGHSNSWQQFLGAGRRHVEAEFSAIRQGDRLGEIYEAVVSGTIGQK